MLVYAMSLEQTFPLAHSRKNSASHPNSPLAHTLHPPPVPPRAPGRSLRSAEGGSPQLTISPSRIHPFLLRAARPNPSRINTSVNSSFFIKSLIMNDLKSNRISTRSNKPCIINTSGKYNWKPFRINTSKKHPGEGGDAPDRTPGRTLRRVNFLNASTEQRDV